MSFRLRLTLLAAIAVAASVAFASALVYLVVRDELKDEIDRSLRDRVELAQSRPRPPPGMRRPLGFNGYLQVISVDGPPPPFELPGNERALLVARGEIGPFFSEGDFAGEHVRVLTARIGPQAAIQAARSLDEVDRSLRTIGFVLLGIGLAGIGVAAGLGFVVARTALRPVRELTSFTESVTATRDLSRRLGAAGDDELARLGRSFDSMLDALEAAHNAQRRLVADASHELRTPLASLRTNVEVLAGGGALEPDERARLLRDLVGQVEELTTLVGDLVEIDRESGEAQFEDVRLDEVVAGAVARARARAPQLAFAVEGEPTLVRGDPARIDRAVSNLLDNAVKWSPPGGTVDVEVGNAEVRVRDRGPGIDPADLPYVFDRFYRARSARPLPGSGLGLAIVRQVADSHGGSVAAANAPGGGAEFLLRFLRPS